MTYRHKRVLVLGATGTIGQATTRALIRAGYDVTCLLRDANASPSPERENSLGSMSEEVTVRFGTVTDYDSLRDNGFCGERFDVLISCIASRNGSAKDAWAVDYQANLNALEIAKELGVAHFILVSAICVQNPKLEFQFAKLAFEKELIKSGIKYSIVRPTAYFKSLSGQIKRLKNDKPFLLFGDGRLTSCKPISDSDLGQFVTDAINDPTCHNRILPIGGPGPAITPRDQGEHLFKLLGKPPKYKQIPVRLLDVVIGFLSIAGRVFPNLNDKAEFARIAKYYATESMLVMDCKTKLYDENATPSTGNETLFDFYSKLIQHGESVELGDHSVF
ncbi:MAG: NAD(P)H-binding protein [Pseudomonadota bacterium]